MNLRLELDGVLKSWGDHQGTQPPDPVRRNGLAVRHRGPSDPRMPRFEGAHPEGNYGPRGTRPCCGIRAKWGAAWAILRRGLRDGKLVFRPARRAGSGSMGHWCVFHGGEAGQARELVAESKHRGRGSHGQRPGSNRNRDDERACRDATCSDLPAAAERGVAEQSPAADSPARTAKRVKGPADAITGKTSRIYLTTNLRTLTDAATAR